MNDEITKKIIPVKRKLRIEELSAYQKLKDAASSAHIFGYAVKAELDRLVELTGKIQVEIKYESQ